MTNAARPPIAVVGVSALFPGSIDATGFWADILAGTDRITDVPPSHWLIEDHYDPDISAPDKTYGRRGGFLTPVAFDAMGFGIPPSVMPSTDTAQLLALVIAQRVLDDATRGQFVELNRSRASVILGVTSGQELFGAMASRMSRPMWLQGMRRAGVPEDVALAACDEISGLHPEWTESTFPGLLGNVVAGRIANRLDLGGTNCVTDAACASSFSAISMGVNELYLGDSDLVIAGGVDTMNDIFMYMCFSKTPALSKTEDIRPFSDRADGTMLGEGLGMVALRRLDDAERDGNNVYCVINGVGSSSDGRSKSVYAPVSSGQARALDDAYAKAGYGPDTVELIEAHGTGTVAGDAAEFGGLDIAFNANGRTDRQWCALGSVKSQIGHTKAAAGAAGLIKVVMALHHKVLPQTAKIDRPNPNLDLENSPFYLNTKTRPWVRGSNHERRGSVSSFGFGGSNFHIALSEYVGSARRAPRLRTFDTELVVLCGRDGSDVVEQAKKHAAAATSDDYVRWLAQMSQRTYRDDAPARLAVTACDAEALRDKLTNAIERIGLDPEAPFSTPSGIHFGLGSITGDIAFVFPGQGSQHLFMGAPLAMSYTSAMAAWDLAADSALHDVVFPISSFEEGAAEANEALLTATQWAQPAIGTTSLSMLAVLNSIGLTAAHVGGHSFGELTALHAAGAISDVDLIRVAQRRGDLMANAAQTPGSMTAVSGEIAQVRTIVEQSGIDVVVANHNSPRQVVLSGRTGAIEQAEGALGAFGFACRRLPVATAFHSPVVSGASDAFAAFLTGITFDAPTIPVYANETGVPYPVDADSVRAQLGRQLANPVRFVEMVEAMYANGARTFVEVGPASILSGLIGQILGDRPHRAIRLDKKNTTSVAAFVDGIGQLAAAGAPMNLGALSNEYADMTNPHDIVPPALAITIDGSNYNAPYPPDDLTKIVGPNATPIPASPSAPTPPRPAATPTPEPAALQQVTAAPAAPGVLAAYQAVQQQTADAHTAYLNSVAQAHSAFLDAAHRSIEVLAQLAGFDPSVTVLGAVPVYQTPPALTTPAPLAPLVPAPIPMAAPMPPAPTTLPTVAKAPIAPPATVAPPVVSASAMSAEELTAALLDVVADRTGYPAAMLTLGMELESDLGIDSIKRVEILSAIHDRVPGVPDVDITVMAKLATLGQIVDYLASQTGAFVAPATPLPVAPPVLWASAMSAEELTAALLDVVADRTGYPAAMLTLGMELESDLGIDSIKRVEILSAIHDRVPGVPDVDITVMAKLATLGQIVDYLHNPAASVASASATLLTSAIAVTNPSFGRFIVGAAPSKATGSPLAGLHDGTIAVTDDGHGVARVLVARLRIAGIDAVLVGSVPDTSHAGVIFLGALRRFGTFDDAASVNREAFAAAKAFAPAALRGVFVTVTDLGGSFGCHGLGLSDDLRAWSGGLTGLARTAAIEWPAVGVKAIDVARGGRTTDEIAEAIANELLTGGPDLEVGLATTGERLTLHNTQVDVEYGELPIGTDDVIVVSGGARGVTAAAVIELARVSASTFVLLGRSEFVDEADGHADALDDASLKRSVLAAATARGETLTPSQLTAAVGRIVANREIRTTIASIEKVGGRAMYVSVDITDAAAVATALETVRRRLGSITGVVHGAGVLADKLIADKTVAQFNAVFDTKVVGLRNLLSATSNDALRMLCLFSSVAARTGNIGQADYAMANEVLNKIAIAEHARRDGCVVKALGWGPWAGGMVDPSLHAHFEARGVELIGLDVGARMFVDELASPQRGQVEVVLGDGLPEARRELTVAASQHRV